MSESVFDTGIAEILDKKAEKVAAAEQRRKERADKGEVNKLVMEQSEHGLYTVRYKSGGNPPDSLRGYFTRKQKLLDAIQAHYKSLDVLEV